MKFNELIKKIRTDLNLTQKEFGDKILLSGSTIANWENNKIYPVKDTIIDSISAEFNISRKEIIDSIAESMNISSKKDEYEKNYINYPFLTDDILTLKMSKEELNLFKIIKLQEYLFKTNEKINFDYSNNFAPEDAINTKKSLESLLTKISKIDSNILEEFIFKNNFEDFYIQDLSTDEIIKLLKQKYDLSETHKILSEIENKNFLYYNNNIYYINDDIELNKIYYKNKDGYKEIIKNFYDLLLDSDEEKFTINKDSLYLNNSGPIDFCKYNINNLNEFIFIYSKESDVYLEKKEIYKDKLKEYEENYKIWESKMKRIKELQDLYNDNEKYPDILPPEKPFLNLEKLNYVTLSQKGKYLLEFLNKNFKESSEIKFDENYRKNLEQYLNDNIIVDVFLQEISIKNENKYYLFKDIRKNHVKIEDYLWIKDKNYNLEVGKNYILEGNVVVYEKGHTEGIIKKDFTIDVSSIKLI